MAYIGIDLGTTYCAAAHCVGGTPEIISLEGQSTMPSVVGLLPDGKIAVGGRAKSIQARFPENTVVEVNRQMGEEVEIRLGNQTFSPQEIIAQILLKIKQLAEAELGEDVQGAVISCPAYFKDSQRCAISNAAKIAGLKLLRIITDPTAAAYAYKVTEGADETPKLILVYDLGGGTFDLTVMLVTAGKNDVICTGGAHRFGGGDFDDQIVEWVLERLEGVDGFLSSLNDDGLRSLRKRLRVHAEKAKIELCNLRGDNSGVRMLIPDLASVEGVCVSFDETLTRDEFESRIDGLLDFSSKEVDRTLGALRNHGYVEADISDVLLVGGSTRVPAVRRNIEERFPHTRIRDNNPGETVALGAGIVAASAAGEFDFSAEEDAGEEMILVDVTGHTISVEVMNEQGQTALVPIIAKETKIPCKGEHRSAVPPGVTSHSISFYQGESHDPSDPESVKIGEFSINIDRINEATPVLIGLEFDQNGLLVAHAFNEFSQEETICQIDYDDSSRTSEQELEEKQKRLAATLDSVIGSQAPAGMDAAPSGGMPVSTSTPGPGAAQGAPLPARVDPTHGVNPILRNLYKKAINDFNKIPAHRQPMVMELVSKIEKAALVDDQQSLNKFTAELSSLLPPTIIEPANTAGGCFALGESVQFTAYRPKRLTPGRWAKLLVFAHLEDRLPDTDESEPDPIEEVRRQAKQVLGENIGDFVDKTKDSRVAIPRESEMRIVPYAEGIRFRQPERRFIWVEGISVHREEFDLKADEGMEGKALDGRLTVYFGSLILAEIDLRFKVEGARVAEPEVTPLEPSQPVRPYQRIFASYSRRDTPIVEQAGYFAKSLGNEFLRDLVHLRSGEDWSPRLREMIEEADVFQLFWSANSAKSPFVEMEWRHALGLGRSNFIRPTFWESPIPDPPKPLTRFHFQKLNGVETRGELRAGENSFPATEEPSRESPKELSETRPSHPVRDGEGTKTEPDVLSDIYERAEQLKSQIARRQRRRLGQQMGDGDLSNVSNELEQLRSRLNENNVDISGPSTPPRDPELRWAGDDLSQRYGFRGSRFVKLSTVTKCVLLFLVLALVAALAILVWKSLDSDNRGIRVQPPPEVK
jgi:molecular chaperone DnaK